MVAEISLSAEMTEAEWIETLRKVGEANGAFSDLSPAHLAVFQENAQDCLFVGFETMHGIRSTSETASPIAFDVCERTGWSHLSVIAKKPVWFRDDALFAFFDNLVDFGYFDQFAKVIFYGAGMCGYAAAAFSVVAPGAQVILVAPQATLDRNRTEWDDRFPSSRLLDFSGRYADATLMLEAAACALVIYDPEEREDAMHASLFQGGNIEKLRYRRGSAGAIEGDLRGMSLISGLAEAAAADKMKAATAAKLLRARKRHVPYLRALLSRVLVEDRPELTAQLCRAVLKTQTLPRFQHHLNRAEEQLGISRAPSRETEDQVS